MATMAEPLPLPPQRPLVWLPPLLLLAAMALVWLGGFNIALFLAINPLGLYTGPTPWQWVTVLGDTLVVLSLALLLVGRRPRLLWGLFITALVATALVHGLKQGTDLWRPAGVLEAGSFQVIGVSLRAFSFPSGHTATAFAFAGLLVMGRVGGRLTAIALLGGALLVGISRIVVGAHWPVDVLGGAAIGWGSAALGLWWAQWGQIANWPLVQQGVALLLILAALLLLFHDSGYPAARLLQMLLAAESLVLAAPQLAQLFRPRPTVAEG